MDILFGIDGGQKDRAYIRRETFINCAVCGKRILKDGPTKRVCKEKCEPYEGMTQVCVRCGKDKPYDEYYDYRDRNRECTKLYTACKECIRARTRKNWRDSHLK